MTLYTINQTVDYLGISKQTLAKYRISGKGPKFVKLGKQIRYSQESLEQWISKQTYSSTAQYQ